MRLFIAVELEKDIIAAFCSLHDELKRRADKMRFVPLQNLHLTLFFLGNTLQGLACFKLESNNCCLGYCINLFVLIQV